MMKKHSTNFDVTRPISSSLQNTKISNSLSRNFGYKLSDKKAKSNLLDSAAREPFEIIERQLCSMLFFSVGSYLEAVFPTVLSWKNGKKTLETKNLSINIVDVLPGYDKDGKHIDTVVTFNVNGQKIVTICYNTTQKIKVEGRGYLLFVDEYLKSLFINILNNVGANKIDDYNKGVIAALSGKRKAVSRPVRSVRYKETERLACSKCDLKFLNSYQLSLHKASTHTKSSSNYSLPNVSAFPIIDDISLMNLSATTQEIPEIELECPVDDADHRRSKCDAESQSIAGINRQIVEEHNSEDITLSYTCGKCDHKFQRITDLNMHIDDRHKPKETATLQVGDINMIQNKNDRTTTNKSTSQSELAGEISICGECLQQFSTYG